MRSVTMSSRTNCPECDELLTPGAKRCRTCGWQDKAEKASTGRCRFEIDGERCPLWATIDRSWCVYHHEPHARAKSDANRQAFLYLVENWREIVKQRQWRDRLVDERMASITPRQAEETRDQYRDRVFDAVGKMLEHAGKGASKTHYSAEYRRRKQEEAAEQRIPAIRVTDIEDVTDDFEVELERLIRSGLSREQAAGVAFENTLRARLGGG